MTISVSSPPLAPPVTAASAEPGGVLAPPAASPGSLFERALRVGRALFVGAWASVLDFAVVALCIRALSLEPTLARVIGLVLSGLLLFFGNRTYAFRAQAGSIARQARRFVLAELIGLCLNLVVFRLLVDYAPVIPPEFSSQLANSLVFLTFAYPVRAFLVFRVPNGGAPDLPR